MGGGGVVGKTDRLLAQEKYVIAVATQCGNSPWQQQVAQGWKFAFAAFVQSVFVCLSVSFFPLPLASGEFERHITSTDRRPDLLIQQLSHIKQALALRKETLVMSATERLCRVHMRLQVFFFFFLSVLFVDLK